jgi:hypothetical protein
MIAGGGEAKGAQIIDVLLTPAISTGPLLVSSSGNL